MSNVVLNDLDGYIIYPAEVVNLNGVYDMERLSSSKSLHFYLKGEQIEETTERRFQLYGVEIKMKKSRGADVKLLEYNSEDVFFVRVKR